MTARLLEGVRVVEMTEVWAGPMAGSLLGDLGADVIKVESFPRSSMTRPSAGGLTAPGEGEGPVYERYPIHQLANRNKRNIALDLSNERGAEVFARLLESADVFFEGYSAGTVSRLGFGWERVHEINRRCSLISMPGWGVAGPYEGYVTLGSGLDSTVGHWSVRGYPGRDREDVQQIYHSDATGAVTLVFATVAALRRREQCGEGSFIDLSQTEAFAWQLPGIYAEYTLNGRIPGPLGNLDPHIVPHNVYRAAAGLSGDEAWVVVAAENDAQWAGLATALGHEEWAADGHAWSTVHGRLGARDAIDAAVGEFVATQVAEDAAEAIQSAGAIAGTVAAPLSVVASPQHLARGWLEQVDHPVAGTHQFPGFLWRTAPDATSWDRYAALVGEHNHEVLAEVGYDAASIEALLADGVIGDRYD
jgi:crotonobetainyl-CoA:carnitine CoA-transferase CaiB-like acyl-CoA transferase